jgi:hypothetical protein
MPQEFTFGTVEVVVWCAVNTQQIIHFRTSECATKLVYMLQSILGGRKKSVLAVLKYIKFLSELVSCLSRVSQQPMQEKHLPFSLYSHAVNYL